MDYEIKLLSKTFVSHNVKRYIFSKPEGFKYQSGQWIKLHLTPEESRPFTLSSTPNELILELTIKTYHERDGYTQRIWDLEIGETVHITKANGNIKYDGPGLFIAAGTGITPFMSIFRNKWNNGEISDSALMYSVKRKEDILYENELEFYFSKENDDRITITLTQEKNSNYENGRISKADIEKICKNPNCKAYICGPRSFVTSMTEIVKELGFPEDSIIFD